MNIKIKNDEYLKEVKICSYNNFEDKRGIIWTSFKKEWDAKLLPEGVNFVHDKFNLSKKNVLRGIHGDQDTYKLISCVYGKIFQVVVDCRINSKNFGKHTTFELNHLNPKSILIPPGFGNGFLVSSSKAIYHYKLAYKGKYNDSEKQFTYSWNNKNFKIKWPNLKPILSKRDSECA